MVGTKLFRIIKIISSKICHYIFSIFKSVNNLSAVFSCMCYLFMNEKEYVTMLNFS